MLHKFFAVTVHGSLYEVSDERGENSWPIVRRISGPENPEMPPGTCLRNGHFVGIGDMGICLFGSHPRYGRHFEHMNTVCWGGHTTAPVALFLDRSSAEQCLVAGDLRVMDDRFQKETVAVLCEIGDDHEVFGVGDSIKKRCRLILEPKI